MALLWSEQDGDSRYEVRSAGNTRRLYTNGVFHSQYNPNNPVTGSVWDLLLLPAFFLPPGRPRRVLVLGVGGGENIRGQQVEAGVTSLVRIRYPRGTRPAASMRLLIGTGATQRVLNISRVLDKDGWQRELWLHCKEIDDG